MMRTPFMIIRSAGFSNKLKDKEAGEERLFFNKQDEHLLKNLLKKMQTQTEVNVDEAKIQAAEKQLTDLCK
jgi:hypothetical protein